MTTQFQDLKHFTAGAALAIFAWPLPPSAQADSSVWVVSNGETRLFLGGTIHALRPSDFPLPPEFEHAYAAAEEIHFEIDLNETFDPGFQAQYMQASSYNDGRSLASVLSEETYAGFYALAGKFGIPAGALDILKPMPASTMVLMMELSTYGFGPEGVEMSFIERANRDGLPQGALETVEYQLRLLADLAEGNEDAMVADFLEEIDVLEEYMLDIVGAWREGNVDMLDQLLLADMVVEFPADFEAMFTRRNRNWVPQIMTMLEDADTEFVLVGVGHMAGEEGLLELLRREGASVEPLDLPER